jgi:DNA-binding NarL/FixJ family response regulator
MRPRPIRVRIEADGPEAARLLALAEAGGLVLAAPGEGADLAARPAQGLRHELPQGAGAQARGALLPLSRRELEIVSYLVDGWSNAEIASVLRLKVRTVRFHLEGVYAKLGVSRRGEAAREALRLGLLRFDV